MTSTQIHYPLLLTACRLSVLAAGAAAKQGNRKAEVASFMETAKEAVYEEEEHEDYRHKKSAYKPAYKGHSHEEYEDSYGHSYGPEKVSIKLYEKFRSHLRPQEDNKNTFQFTCVAELWAFCCLQ